MEFEPPGSDSEEEEDEQDEESEDEGMQYGGKTTSST